MLDEENDVQSESLPDNEQVVNESAEVDQSAEDQQATTETPVESAQPQGDVPDVEIDEAGVPWKNRAMEYRRKFEGLEAQQGEILKKVSQLQESSSKPKYTENELRSFSETTDNPGHRAWALQEIEKTRQDQTAEVVRKELSKFQSQQEANVAKQQALQDVMRKYPEAFSTNPNGGVTGWDNKSLLAQRIGQYMQDKEISNNPRGLTVAAALAYSDIATSQKSQELMKQQKMKREIRGLQSKTLVEGGGTKQAPPKNPARKAVDKARETGKIKDASHVMKEIFKAQGAIK